MYMGYLTNCIGVSLKDDSVYCSIHVMYIMQENPVLLRHLVSTPIDEISLNLACLELGANR